MIQRIAAGILCVWLTRLICGQTMSDGERWWAMVQALAGDGMEGRNTGSAGYQRAAHYVAEQFKERGLQPAGSDGFYQPIRFRVQQIVEPESSVELVRSGASESLNLADDVNLSLPPGFEPRVEAPLVFVGHGLVIPEFGINDLEGIDLTGKIAVVLGGAPKRVPGPVRAHYSSRQEQWRVLRAAGAVGVAGIRDPKGADVPWARSTLARLRPSMTLLEPSLAETPGLKFSVRINPERAEKFFAGSPHTFADLLKLSEEDKPLPKFPLQARIRATVAAKGWEVECRNVAARLNGTDPKLKDEVIVLTAHLDHLGIGAPIHGDSIYNGALDNAAGVATLIEVASALNTPLKRSILFLAVTGEEKGLLGSKYFANQPTVSLGTIVANLNVDMFLPLFPLRRLEVLGSNESTLGMQARAVFEADGIAVQSDSEPERNLFIRSDQYSFIRRGVPALAFKFGYEPNSPEHEVVRIWLRDRYHAPSDDLGQPVDKAAAARFNRLFAQLVVRVANDPDRPEWRTESFFRRYRQP